MRIISILGLPGSGKGTLCKNIIMNHNCLLLTAGELLRNTKNNDILKIVNAGQLVSSHIIVSLLLNAINKNTSKEYDFILLDGFPRSEENMQCFEHTVGKIDIIINLTTSVDVILSRLKTRNDDRQDDVSNIINKRIMVYNEQTMQVIKNNSNVFEIDCSGDPDSIYEKFKNVL